MRSAGLLSLATTLILIVGVAGCGDNNKKGAGTPTATSVPAATNTPVPNTPTTAPTATPTEVVRPSATAIPTGTATPAAAITGRITDTAADAVAGASVVLVAAADVEATGSIQPLEDIAGAIIAGTNANGVATTTATDGTYSIDAGAVSDGDYFLVVIPAGDDTTHPPFADNQAYMVVNGQFATTATGTGDFEISTMPSADATYIGSATCLGCHPGKDTLKGTLHFLGFRVPGQTNNLQDLAKFPDADKGLDEFNGQCIEFPAKGNTHWAYLSKDADTGDYHMQMGSNATCDIKSALYKVAFTYGGEGVYKQRYMILVGPNGEPGTGHVAAGGDAYYYPAPFQWNESGPDPAAFGENGEFSGKWILPAAEGDNVFAPDGATPGDAPEESFGVDCGGCHGGVAVTKNGNADFVTEYIDQVDPDVYAGNIGCERCHGPGSEHLANGGQGKYIVTPDRLTPGRATVICGTCHQRGHGHSVLSRNGDEVAHAGFASTGDLTTGPDAKITVFKPGMSPAAFYGSADGSGIQPKFGTVAGFFEPIDLETNSHSWQDKVFGAEFNHSKGHHQQYMDLVRTVMFRNDREMLACFSCHDAHGSDHEHQLKHDPDNNAACLECHNGDDVDKGNLETITDAMVEDLQNGQPADPAIGTAVEEHMSEFAGMVATYDPEGTGVGRCTKCHMPKTAKTARWHDMSNGWREGDMHSHTFDAMSKEAITQMFDDAGSGSDPTKVTPAGWTNSCGPCHSLPALP